MVSPRVFMSTAEPSGDRYAADLLRALQARIPSVESFGLGGPGLCAAGCELIEDLTSRSAMLLDVVRQIPRGYMLVRRVVRLLAERRPAVCVFIDSGFLNLRLARHARRLGIPTLYYVCPQVWASRESRVAQLRRDLDHVACILPFEEPWLRARGVAASFVGHPLFDLLAEQTLDERLNAELRAAGGTRLVLMPGSRASVIRRNLPIQLAVADLLGRKRSLDVHVACASDAAATLVRQSGGNLAGVTLHVDRNATLLSQADLAIVTSGTATLEAAYHGCAMVVVYQSTPKWLWHAAGRRIVKTPYLCMPNILAGRELVPEFMPYVDDVGQVATAAEHLLDPARNADQRQQLRELIKPLTRPGVAQRVADVVLAKITQ